MSAYLSAILSSKRMFLLLIMGFSSGLPLPLTIGTLQAWMTVEGVNLKTIGAFTLVGLPYTLKFLWSPLLDHYSLSFLNLSVFGETFALGRRRSWMLLSQLILAALIISMGMIDPVSTPLSMAIFALLVAFFSATQDIAVDAYRAEIVTQEQLGLAASVAILGHRLGMLLSSSIALMLSVALSWQAVYATMGAAMLVGVVATLLSEEPKISQPANRRLRETFYLPLLDFFKRSHAIEIFCFVLLYKVGDVLAASLSTTFFIQQGFSRLEIGAVSKGLGVAATIAGAMFGGALMLRLSMQSALVWFGILQAISTLMFFALSLSGTDHVLMASAVGIENFCGGLGTAAFVAFLMGLCSKSFTATQYALLSSLAALPRSLMGPLAADLVGLYGWSNFFLISTLLATPGLIMLFRYKLWSAELQRETSYV